MKERDKRMEKKLADQAGQIARLRQELAGAEAALGQWSAAVDAVLTAAAVTLGERTEEGWRLDLPAALVETGRAGYELTARADRERGRYVLTARARGTEGTDETKPV